MKPALLTILLALGLALPARPVRSGEPNPQLLLLIEHNLRPYGIEVETALLSVGQAAQLHLLLTSDDLGYLETRRRIKAILRAG